MKMIWRRGIIVIATMVCLLGKPASSVALSTYYIDNMAGSDSNPGTSADQPWQSISKVNNTPFQPGDVINFKRGSTWTGTTLVINSSGVSGNPVTYQAYGTGDSPVIVAPSGNWQSSIEVRGAWNVIKDFLLSGGHQSGLRLFAGADHNTVEGIEVTQAGFGVFIQSEHNLITRNYVHDTKIIVSDSISPNNDYGATCFWIENHNNEVSYNRGVKCRALSIDYGTDGGFVEIWQRGDNSYVHHNYAEGTNGFFELGASDSLGSAANVRVVYNVMYDVLGDSRVPGTAICFNTGVHNITVTGFRFEHNTWVRTVNDRTVYRVFGCRTNLDFMTVRNNIFYSNVQIANTGNFTHANNLYHMVNMVSGSGVGYDLSPGEIMGNPLFVDLRANSQNFQLQSASPAIDKGLSPLRYSPDMVGRVVPSGASPEMGAFEYQSGPPPVSINDNAIEFSYSAGWGYLENNPGNYMDDDHWATIPVNSPGPEYPEYQVSFNGVQAKIYSKKAPWHGEVGVSIDGDPETFVDLYAPIAATQVLVYTSPNLVPGPHTLKVRLTGGKNPSSTESIVYANADRVDVSQQVVSINDNAIEFSYSAGWGYLENNPGNYMNDDHWSNTPGAEYQVSFDGVQAKIFAKKAPYHGKVGVSIDGDPETFVDLYAPTEATQALVYTSPNLVPGRHTLKVRLTGDSTDKYVNADRVDIKLQD